jgi:hypothetical protein
VHHLGLIIRTELACKIYYIRGANGVYVRDRGVCSTWSRTIPCFMRRYNVPGFGVPSSAMGTVRLEHNIRKNSCRRPIIVIIHGYIVTRTSIYDLKRALPEIEKMRKKIMISQRERGGPSTCVVRKPISTRSLFERASAWQGCSMCTLLAWWIYVV